MPFIYTNIGYCCLSCAGSKHISFTVTVATYSDVSIGLATLTHILHVATCNF